MTEEKEHFMQRAKTAVPGEALETIVYRTAYSFLIACMGLLGIGSIAGMGEVSIMQWLAVLGMAAALSVFGVLNIRGKLITMLSGFVCGVTIYLLMGREAVEELRELYHAGREVEALEILQGGFLQGIVLFLTAACAFGIQLLFEKMQMLKYIFACAGLGLLLWALLVKYSLSHGFVCLMVLFICAGYVEWTQTGWRKQRGNRRKRYLVWLLPFLLFYWVLLLVMPISDKPYDWRFVKDACEWLKTEFYHVSRTLGIDTEEDFEIVVSGFSEDGKLLGGLTREDKELMRLRGKNKLKTNVYLIGKIYDSFSGMQWTATNECEEAERLLDAMETASAVYLYDKEKMEDYISLTEFQVEYQDFNTGYVFAPLKSLRIEEKIPYGFVGGNLVFEEMQGYGTGYDVRCLQLNVDHPIFYGFLDDMLQREAAGSEEWSKAWDKMQELHGKGLTRDISFEALELHRDSIYEIYGKPPLLSTEMKGYLEEITGEGKTVVERLKAIEGALAGLTYTLTPGALPESILSETEFLDYFLLESRQGFCSYFATAFVLLARAEGIPARYVEGFCVPAENGGDIVVSSGMAHAWPEVYIEGVGWIPFEPTPGYERLRYTPWEVRKESAENSQGNMSWEIEEEEAEDYDIAVSEPPAFSDENSEKTGFGGSLLKAVIYCVILLAGLGGSFYLFDVYMDKYRYKHWSEEKRMFWLLQRNLRLLGLLGYQRAENETLEELQHRAWAIVNYETENGNEKLHFLRYYEDALYGGHICSKEGLETIYKERLYLLQQIRKWKPLVYWYCRVMRY